MIEIPGFRTVLRGYDPTEVDRAIGDLIKARDQARSAAADNALACSGMQTELAQAQEQAAAYRNQLARVEVAPPEPTTPAVEVGTRIGRMLELAEDEAREVRAHAAAESERVLAAARAEADQLTGNAERRSRDILSKADTEAARILEAARRQSDEIVDHADREAVARREEAEAIYEAHRARAAALADDFERGLAERRQLSETEFRLRAMAAEEELRALADRQATVKEQSRRELQATLEQRDAVLVQLVSLRELLATVDLAASDAPAETGGTEPEATVGTQAAGEPEDAADEPDGGIAGEIPLTEGAGTGRTESGADAHAEADRQTLARSGTR